MRVSRVAIDPQRRREGGSQAKKRAAHGVELEHSPSTWRCTSAAAMPRRCNAARAVARRAAVATRTTSLGLGGVHVAALDPRAGVDPRRHRGGVGDASTTLRGCGTRSPRERGEHALADACSRSPADGVDDAHAGGLSGAAPRAPRVPGTWRRRPSAAASRGQRIVGAMTTGRGEARSRPATASRMARSASTLPGE